MGGPAPNGMKPNGPKPKTPPGGPTGGGKAVWPFARPQLFSVNPVVFKPDSAKIGLTIQQ